METQSIPQLNIQPELSIPPVNSMPVATPKQSKLPLIILSLVTILLTILAVFFYQKLQKNSPTTKMSEKLTEVTSPTPDPLASWQSYYDSRYDFSFLYPQDSAIIKDDIDNQEVVFSQFVVSVEQSNKTINDYVSSLRDSSSATPIYDKTIVGSAEWIGYYKNAPAHFVSVKNGQNIYSVLISPTKDTTKFDQEESNLLNQILSTFKFNSAQTKDNAEYNGWKDFSNNLFTFKYPGNWTLGQNNTALVADTAGAGASIYVMDNMYNECMQLDKTEKLSNVTVKYYSYKIGTEACSNQADIDNKQAWLTDPAKQGFGPGLIYEYNTKMYPGSENILSLMIKSFKF